MKKRAQKSILVDAFATARAAFEQLVGWTARIPISLKRAENKQVFRRDHR